MQQMIERTQTPPTAVARLDVATKVTVRDSEVIDSGTVITTKSDGLTLQVSDLIYEIAFDDDSEWQGSTARQLSEKKIRIELSNFTNPLGTSLHSLEIGTISGLKLWLSLFVEAVGADMKVVSYTVYLGGEIGK